MAVSAALLDGRHCGSAAPTADRPASGWRDAARRRSSTAMVMGTPMKAPNRPHRIRPEEHGEQHHERRDGQRAAGDARLDVAADDELDDVQAGEHQPAPTARCELRQCEQGREHGGDERADEGDVVQREGDDAPFGRQLQAGERRPTPRRARRSPRSSASGSAVSAELGGSLWRCPRAGHALPSRFSRRPDAAPGVIDLEQPENDVDEHDQPEADGGVDAPRDVLDRAHQPAHVEMLGPQRRHAMPGSSHAAAWA